MADRGNDRAGLRHWALVGFLLSCAVGIVREIVQNWGDVDGSLGDSIFDGAAWCFGALMALAGMWWWSRRL